MGFFAFCSDFGFLDWFSCWFSRAVFFFLSRFGTRAFLEELIQCGMTGGFLGGLGWIGFWIGLQFFFPCFARLANVYSYLRLSFL